jgi:imidazolonepropionase-like amidohydrolase
VNPLRRRAAGLAVVLITASSTGVGAGERVFLVGGRLHVGNGRVIENSVIEIVGDTFAAVSEYSEKRVPDEIQAIDVSGHWITPGFIAGASQLGLLEISLEGLTRDTTQVVEDPIRSGYDPAPAINADSSLLAVQAIEGITSAAVSPVGGLLSGQVSWIDLLPGDHVGIVAARGIAVSGAVGAELAGSRATSLELLRRVLADARFLAANRDQHDRRALRDLAAHPMDLHALIPVLNGTIPLIVWADRASDILALLDIAKEFKIKIAIQGGAEAWKTAGQLARAQVPVLLTPTRNLPEQFDALGARLDAASLLAEAGVPLAIINQDGTHNARNIGQEAGIAVANGLDWEQALSAVTLGVARAYGMDDVYGSVEPGKIANLVVWDGDPFELSTAATRVLIRGREIPRVSRQTLLRDRYLDLSKYRP